MDNFKKEYLKWLNDNIIEIKKGDCVEITTPFLDRHNDWLQIFIEEINGQVYITDDGYIVDDLKMCGVDLTTPNRKALLTNMINGYGVKLSDKNELYVNADPNTFAQKKHALIQCMIAVNDLYVTSNSRAVPLFINDLEDYFNKSKIIYSKNVSIIGKTGFNNKFDFIVPKIKNKKETLIKAINSPDKNKIQLALFQCNDTAEMRADEESQFMIVMNDSKRIPPDLVSSCKNYNTIPITWHEKCEMLKYLPTSA